MKAALLDGVDKIVLKEVATPTIKPGSILLKILACGVCGSDLRILSSGNNRVKYPAIIGHEIVGEVVAIGEGVSGFSNGDRLAVGADVPCGECVWCTSGNGNCCDVNYAMGYQFSGGYAEYCLLEPLVVSHGAVEKVPQHVSSELATFMEPLACCINGFERIGFVPGKTVLVIGAGQIGCMLAMLAKASGSKKVILADVSDEKLSVAKKSGSADQYINNSKPDFKDSILGLTDDKGADFIFTACSSADAQEQALSVLAKRGAINFFGGLPTSGPGARNISVSSNLLHYSECTLTGSHGSVPRQNRLATELISSGRLFDAFSGLITHRFRLSEIQKAFELRRDPKALRVVVFP
ncbi:MAG: alcohol dehydrogenase catalytic domain-containing protein [Candidatus Micrarchaeota archaeon]